MARGRKRNRVNATGRTETSRFARLDHAVLKSAAYSALTPNSRSLLLELTMMENGKNNGSLWLSVDDAAARMGLADPKSASAAFDQLQALGFIAMTKDAHFRVKASATARARHWRLTWLPALGKRATNDFLGCDPAPKSRDRKRMERRQRALKSYGYAIQERKTAVEDSSMLAENPPIAVEDSSTANAKSGEKSSMPIVEDSYPYTAVTMGYGGQPEITLLRGFKPKWALGPLATAAQPDRIAA